MDSNELKYLEENFKKLGSLNTVIKKIEESQKVWVEEEGNKILYRYPKLLSVNTINSRGSSKNYIYVSSKIKDIELKKLFSDLEFGIMYDENFKCDQYLSYFPYAGVHLKNKSQLSSLKDYFEKNISKTIDRDFASKKDNCVWTGEGGVWICFGEDCFNRDSGNLSAFPKNLNELSEQLNKLCNEVIRLIKNYK
ncbi:MAG: hypothetical protein HY840_02520 [Bacteroidetes bacterium]|nr:hypothetical protein [Bacteroidota bacterium]